jgi:hypothetical protein
VELGAVRIRRKAPISPILSVSLCASVNGRSRISLPTRSLQPIKKRELEIEGEYHPAHQGASNPFATNGLRARNPRLRTGRDSNSAPAG